jgi:hypothetical protein
LRTTLVRDRNNEQERDERAAHVSSCQQVAGDD